MKRFNLERGFSLVELMVVVAIIGVLAAIAIPKFQVFQVKARQAEAKSNLHAIYTLQQAYYAENDAYGAMSPVSGPIPTASCPTTTTASAAGFIGFVIGDCSKLRYRYTNITVAAPASFTATALSGTGANNKVAPGCATADRHTINSNGLLTTVTDASKLCN